MLNTDTKRKIDNARNILVGIMPTPTGQVEQITLALIYKFMSDIDSENVKLGGKPKFFTGEYKQCNWTNLIDIKLSAQERVKLYGEGLEKMSRNPNLPELFRNIFKGAFLPFRNPEVLKLFLNQINEFEYTHSEELGNAFEYLLSVMGSQGDAGQFRTPRHIIDFIVQCVAPDKNDRILDPACGTAGFLISAYKYILEQNKDKFGKPGSGLSFKERRALSDNFIGYDISHDMVRLSSVNLFLHDFPDPKIFEYDTLGSLDKWDDDFDVILANPPFMTPKGGVKPHRRFSIQANRSEVLFVDYIAEHLNANGRAGVIVPEGIIFQSANAYKQLRKMLVENYLYAVVSLPAGIFQPYSGVKTSILLMDKSLAKKTNSILFVKVENDGYDLGAQRREIDKNDLPAAIEVIKNVRTMINKGLKDYHNALNEWIKNHANQLIRQITVQTTPKEKIAANSDYNLSIDRYRINENIRQSKFEMVRLGDVAEFEYGYTDSALEKGDVRFIRITDIAENGFLKDTDKKYITLNDDSKKYLLTKNDLLVARTGATFGKTLIYKEDYPSVFASYLIRIKFKENNIVPKYYWAFSKTEQYWKQANELVSGGGQPQFNANAIKEINFPLPPLSIQQEIVNKIEAWQKIIDGAKQVVENYKPHIEIKPEWEMVELGSVCEINSKTILPTEVSQNGKFIYLDISSVENGTGIYTLENLIEINDAPSRARREIKINDVLLSTVRPNLKAFALLQSIPSNAIASTGFAVLRCKESLNPKFIYELLFTDFLQEQMISKMGKGAYPSINQTDVENLQIPLPSLPEQQAIVSRIEKEQELVNANKELIKVFEQKIKDEIEKLWKN